MIQGFRERMNIMSEKMRAPKKDTESPKDTNKFIERKTTQYLG